METIQMDAQTPQVPGDEDMIRKMFSHAANTIVEASSLRKEVQALTEQVGQLAKVVEELKGQNEGLKTELENVRKERDEARQKLWEEEHNHAQTKGELDTTKFTHNVAVSDLRAMEGRWKDALEQKEFYEAEAMKFEEFLKRANAKLAKAKEAINAYDNAYEQSHQAMEKAIQALDMVDVGEVKEASPQPSAPSADSGEFAPEKEYGWSEQEQKYGWWNKQGRDEEGRFQTFPQAAKSATSE
jgi:chromosome segregation ATPase